MRRVPTRWSLACVFAMFALALAGCPDDPHDPQTWIDKLDDPREQARAVTELQRLGDPVAIPALSKLWRKANKSSRVLRVIVELAATPKDPDTRETLPPQWEKALPVLKEAVDQYDPGDQASVDNAVLAADALGRAKDNDAVEVLVRAVQKKLPAKEHRGQRVRLSAIKALGEFGNNPRAVKALIKVLDADPEKELPAIFGAAVIALGEARSTEAIVPLLETMYKLAPFYQQCRRALVAIGPPAIKELEKVMKGEHEEINALAKQYKFNIDCKKEMGPETSCMAPTNLEFKAAQLLGDMYAEGSLDLLLAELGKDALPAFFQEGAPGPSQHTAVLDAIRKIGPNEESADRVEKYMFAGSTDDVVRPIAIDVYSYLTSGTGALSGLGSRIIDDEEDEQVRMSSGLTFGRMVRTENDLSIDVPKKFRRHPDRAKMAKPIHFMIGRYRDAAAKAEKEAAPVVAKWKELKDEQERISKAFNDSTDQKERDKLIKEVEAIKEKLDAQTQKKSPLEGKVRAYQDFQMTFQQNLVRALTGIHCEKAGDPGKKAECYVAMLDNKADEIIRDLCGTDKGCYRDVMLDKSDALIAKVMCGADKACYSKAGMSKEEAEKKILAGTKNEQTKRKFTWSNDEKVDFKVAAVERALLEIIKLGDKARSILPKLWPHAASSDRITRQGTLMALVQVAEKPCKECVEKLDEIIDAQQDETTLRALTYDTQTVRNYFLWAGKH